MKGVYDYLILSMVAEIDRLKSQRNMRIQPVHNNLSNIHYKAKELEYALASGKREVVMKVGNTTKTFTREGVK